MPKKLTSVYMLGIMFMLGGCAAHRTSGPNFIIEPPCLTKAVVLKGCDTSTDPPTRCKQSVINYKKGCGKIEILPTKATIEVTK
jgi:hypothetical protein